MIRTEEDIYFVLRKLSETSTNTITVPQEVEKSGRIRKARIYKTRKTQSLQQEVLEKMNSYMHINKVRTHPHHTQK